MNAYYQTTAQAIECDERQHARECSRFVARHPDYEQLVRGDVVEFNGQQKTVDHEEVMKFAVVVYFTDGTVEDKINLFFAKDAKRISKRVGNLVGVFLSE